MNELLSLRKEILAFYYDIRLDGKGFVKPGLSKFDNGLSTGLEWVLEKIDERIEELDDAQTEG